MIQPDLAEPVIQYLHGLTYDGVLTGEEIWNLAQWLNKQPANVLESWPAKDLVKALNSAFEDQVLTAAEMDELAQLIIAIEQLWMEYTPTAPEPVLEAEAKEASPAPAAAGTMAEKAILPAFDFKTEVAGPGGDVCAVELKKHTCTCHEWLENRTDFAEEDFRRCCPHVAAAYSRWKIIAGEPLEPIFDAFIEDHRTRGRGTLVDEVWQVATVKEEKILYGASPLREWIEVYAPGRQGYQRFGYNQKEQRWAYGEMPRKVSGSFVGLLRGIREARAEQLMAEERPETMD